MPDFILGPGDTTVNRVDRTPWPHGAHSPLGCDGRRLTTHCLLNAFIG